MMATIGQSRGGPPRGSALILTVVLTSLLAIVGVLFVMAARIDKMASSAVSDNRDLSLAVDTVLARIDAVLVEDVDGIAYDSKGSTQEYYDYPDASNAWLASLEPSSTDPNYWPQISDLAGALQVSRQNVRIRQVDEREPIIIPDPDPGLTNADADGDGVGDARWFLLPGETSSKGRPIYAAVRIIDNGGMLNLNTGYVFDPNGRVEGNRQLQINVLALAAGPGAPLPPTARQNLLSRRTNYDTSPLLEGALGDYEKEVIWKYLDVAPIWTPARNQTYSYTPFDTADELELRYRFLVNQRNIATRAEDWGWFAPNNPKRVLETPVDAGGKSLRQWFHRAAPDPRTGALDPNYAYRHIATTYNMDRVLPPTRRTTNNVALPTMVGVNRLIRGNAGASYAAAEFLRDVIVTALADANPSRDMVDIGGEASQIAANLVDFIDDDDKMTVLPGTVSSDFYGFERPCVYLSEVAYRGARTRTGGTVRSYAVELYKPYYEDDDPGRDLDRSNEWRLGIQRPGDSEPQPIPGTLVWYGRGTRRFQVLVHEDPAVPLRTLVSFSDGDPANAVQAYGYNPANYSGQEQNIAGLTFEAGDTIALQRRVGVTRWQSVDTVVVPNELIINDDTPRSIQREIRDHRCIWRRWGPPAARTTLVLGNGAGHFVDPSCPPQVQAHPANLPLMNIGQLGMIFVKNAYNLSDANSVGEVLLNLRNANYQRLFNYLTVMDPAEHIVVDPNQPVDPSKPAETRVMGRININTAPWFVLAQLPWLQHDPNNPPSYRSFTKAQAIVAYRNDHGAYHSIGELMRVDALLKPGSDGKDNQYDNVTDPKQRGPDLTLDTLQDDFEERDLFFTRISDLVTVRSDVFTAYILVRLGPNGPQKRIIAVLDRSRANAPGDRVRIVAEQAVPDPW
jgi:hypothetical protein